MKLPGFTVQKRHKGGVVNVKTGVTLSNEAVKKIEEALQKGRDVELQNRKDGLVILSEEKVAIYKG